MNLCALKGKVIEDVRFDFLYNSKRISVAKMKLKLRNGSIITIKGHDEMADWMYKNIIKNYDIVLYGRVDSKLEIEYVRAL